MGKILQPQVEYVKETIDKRISENYSEFTTQLGSAPIFVTYFNQNLVNTTLDNGFGNTYGNASSESSSKRYNKINNVPLFKVPKSDLDTAFDEGRISVSFEITGVLPPKIFTPIPEDYMIIHYMDKDRIFKITGFDVDNIKSNRYFSLKMKFDGNFSFDNLNSRVVNTYECIYNKIGTEENCLLLEENISYVEDLQELFDELVEEYKDMFFDRKADSFLFRWTNRKILYDPYLTKFISDSKLFEKKYDMRSLHIEEKIKPMNGFRKKYNNSIYHSIEKKEKIECFRNFFRASRIYDLSSYFGTAVHDYCQVELYDHNYPTSKPLYNLPYMDFHIIKEQDPIGADYLIDPGLYHIKISFLDKFKIDATTKIELANSIKIDADTRLIIDEQTSLDCLFNLVENLEMGIDATTKMEMIEKLKLEANTRFEKDDYITLDCFFNIVEDLYTSIDANTSIKFPPMETKIKAGTVLEMNEFVSLNCLFPLIDIREEKIDATTNYKYEPPMLHYEENEKQIETFENIIRDYLNDSVNINMIIETLEDFEIRYTFNYFTYIPIVLFIIKNTIDNININKI